MKRIVPALLAALALTLALAAAAQAKITVSPESLTFQAQQGGAADEKTATVEVTEDEGQWNVTHIQIASAALVTGAYAVQSDCPVVVLDGKGTRTCVVSVRFEPKKIPEIAGSLPAVLWIALEPLGGGSLEQLKVDLNGTITPTDTTGGGTTGGEARKNKERRRQEREQAREERRNKGKKKSGEKKANKSRCAPKKKRKGKGKSKAGKSQAAASAAPKGKAKGKRKPACGKKKQKRKGKGKTKPRRVAA